MPFVLFVANLSALVLAAGGQIGTTNSTDLSDGPAPRLQRQSKSFNFMPMLQFGLFDDFKFERTLLVWGDRESLGRVEEAFRALADGCRESLAFEGLPRAISVDGTRVTAVTYPGGGSTLTVIHSGMTEVIELRCSTDIWQTFADQVQALRTIPGVVGHAYLDVSADQPIQLMVSIGEYSADLRS